MKINMMSASLICLTGFAAICANAQTNNSATSKIKIVALPNGAVQVDGHVLTTNGMVSVQIHHEKIEMQNMADNSRSSLDLLAIHDPRMHFVFWHVQRGLNTNSLVEWCNHMWLVPDVGLIRIGCSHGGFLMEIYNSKTADFNGWKTNLMENLAIQWGQGLTLPACDEVRVSLKEYLGEAFFSLPGDARIPPAAVVSSMKHSAAGWEICLSSSVTPDTAIVWLDPSFTVIRAVRNGETVFPK